MHSDFKARKADQAVLTCENMGKADAYAIKGGVSGPVLMERAGQAMAREILDRWAPRSTAVLCGPGNNGGDGWVVARHLYQMGWSVTLFSLVPVSDLKGDAAWAAAQWAGRVCSPDMFDPADYELVVDALFGAGLSRPVEGEAARMLSALKDAQSLVVAADVPTGMDGDTARADGVVCPADLTVTFHRFKPGHLLEPGRSLCGECVCADIGIPEGWSESVPIEAEHNDPILWSVPGLDLPRISHKHTRGRLCVLSGPRGASGAAQLAAKAGLIGGAGFVTILSGEGALNEIASASPELVSRSYDRQAGFGAVLTSHRAHAAVVGPGAGVTDTLQDQVLSALGVEIPLVLDADALSVFEDAPQRLFAGLHPHCVLTPHGGEFSRLFPDLAKDLAIGKINKITATRTAAQRAGATVLFKGPDTVIAHPDGRVRINTHASSRLATAGTGDVLAGLIGAFLAQGQSAFDAASAAVWLHGDAGLRLGPGAIVTDVLSKLPSVLSGLRSRYQRMAALHNLTGQRR